jgi:hypothetical protein
MSMVKVELSVPELRQALESFTQNRLMAMESLIQDVRGSVSTVLNQVLNAEMTVFLGLKWTLFARPVERV